MIEYEEVTIRGDILAISFVDSPGDLVLAGKHQCQQSGHERSEVLGNGAVPGTLSPGWGRGLPSGWDTIWGWSRLLRK